MEAVRLFLIIMFAPGAASTPGSPGIGCYTLSGAGNAGMNGLYVPCSDEVTQARTWVASWHCWMIQGLTEPTTSDDAVLLRTDTSCIGPTAHDYASQSLPTEDDGLCTTNWYITNGDSPAPTVAEATCPGAASTPVPTPVPGVSAAEYQIVQTGTCASAGGEDVSSNLAECTAAGEALSIAWTWNLEYDSPWVPSGCIVTSDNAALYFNPRDTDNACGTATSSTWYCVCRFTGAATTTAPATPSPTPHPTEITAAPATTEAPATPAPTSSGASSCSPSDLTLTFGGYSQWNGDYARVADPTSMSTWGNYDHLCSADNPLWLREDPGGVVCWSTSSQFSNQYIYTYHNGAGASVYGQWQCSEFTSNPVDCVLQSSTSGVTSAEAGACGDGAGASTTTNSPTPAPTLAPTSTPTAAPIPTPTPPPTPPTTPPTPTTTPSANDDASPNGGASTTKTTTPAPTSAPTPTPPVPVTVTLEMDTSNFELSVDLNTKKDLRTLSAEMQEEVKGFAESVSTGYKEAVAVTLGVSLADVEVTCIYRSDDAERLDLLSLETTCAARRLTLLGAAESRALRAPGYARRLQDSDSFGVELAMSGAARDTLESKGMDAVATDLEAAAPRITHNNKVVAARVTPGSVIAPDSQSGGSVAAPPGTEVSADVKPPAPTEASLSEELYDAIPTFAAVIVGIVGTIVPAAAIILRKKLVQFVQERYAFCYKRYQSKTIQRARDNAIKELTTSGKLVGARGELVEWTGVQKLSYHEVKKGTENWSKTKLLGEGGAGSVYQGYIKDSKGSYQDVALKKIPLSGTDEAKAEQIKKLRGECQVMLIVQSSEYVVRMKGVSFDGSSIVVALEHMTGGDMSSVLYGSGDMSSSISTRTHRALQRQATKVGDRVPPKPALLWRWAKQFVTGVVDIHNKGQTHGDIKTENLLLDDSNLGQARVKLADFGLARSMKKGQLTDKTVVTTEKTKEVVTRQGTESYMAPEMLNPLIEAPASTATDAFAVGVVLLQFRTGLQSFDLREKPAMLWARKAKAVKKGEDLANAKDWVTFSSQQAETLDEVIVNLLKEDPEDRASPKQALELLNRVDADVDAAQVPQQKADSKESVKLNSATPTASTKASESRNPFSQEVAEQGSGGIVLVPDEDGGARFEAIQSTSAEDLEVGVRPRSPAVGQAHVSSKDAKDVHALVDRLHKRNHILNRLSCVCCEEKRHAGNQASAAPETNFSC